MWDRPDVEGLRSQDVPWVAVPADDFGAGDYQRVLSEDLSDGARTALLQLTRRHRARLERGADLFVLEGDGLLNGERLAPSTYVFVSPGVSIEFEPGAARTTILFGSLGSAQPDRAAEGTSIVRIDLATVPWTSPEWSGRKALQPGAFVKSLRRGGPEEVFVAAMLPGWRTDAEEVHDVYEESFRISGDQLHATGGLLSAGAYSFRSPGAWHCPAGTLGGVFLLVRSSGPLATEYREPAPERRWSEVARRAFAAFQSPAV